MRIFIVIAVAVSVGAVFIFAIFGSEGIEFAQQIAIPKVGTIEIKTLENADRDKLIWAVDVLNKQNKNTEELYKEVLKSYRKLFNIILIILVVELVLLSVYTLKKTKAKRHKSQLKDKMEPNNRVQGTADSRRL